MFFKDLTSSPLWPLAVLLISVLFIILAIAKFRMHAFVALICASLLAGVAANKETWDVVQKDGQIKSMPGLVGVVELTAKGLGDTARDIAISIAFASIIGMCLMESGAADKVVRRFLAFFGYKNAGWALLWSTYLLSIPIFFDTMFMLMVPLAQALARRTGKDYMLFAMCTACGGVITHSMTIPHPGPLAMVDELQVDTGLSLVAGLLGGLIPAVVGYYFCIWANSRSTTMPSAGANANEMEVEESKLPSFLASVMPVILPIVLIGFSSLMQIVANGAFKEGAKIAWCEGLVNALGVELFTNVRGVVDFIGHKNIALLIGAGISVLVLLRQKGISLHGLERLIGPPLETAGMIILITSAGGAFGFMLRTVGVGKAVESLASGREINLIVLAWVVASVIRVAQGSATVAILTTAGMVKGMLDTSMGVHPVYIYLAIGWGAMFGSWMNDSGFWVVSRLGGFTQKETLQSWSVMLCVLSLTGLVTTLIASWILPLSVVAQ
ncbi:GntP family permease [Pirellulaceae bacterium SH467]|jgi:GntP family gluconate:H+ symporter